MSDTVIKVENLPNNLSGLKRRSGDQRVFGAGEGMADGRRRDDRREGIEGMDEEGVWRILR